MKINYSNKSEVIMLAVSMGPGMTVIKRPEYPNYTIIHTSREPALLRGAAVVHRT